MAELMTVRQLADYLQFTDKTIYRLLQQGRIPGAKLGHSWRFQRAVIDVWLRLRSTRGKARILVVDDDEIIRALFKETLEELGHSVTAVETGLEALEFLESLDFDVIFLDLKMPAMDGAELLHQIRNIKPEVPVVIITGYPDSEMMSRALEEWPLGIMNKPFGQSDIVMAVDNFLRASDGTGIQQSTRSRSTVTA